MFGLGSIDGVPAATQQKTITECPRAHLDAVAHTVALEISFLTAVRPVRYLFGSVMKLTLINPPSQAQKYLAVPQFNANQRNS